MSREEADRPESAQRRARVLRQLAVLVVLVLSVPAILYSITPAGPIREGDRLYATGRHEVRLQSPEQYAELGYTAGCFLEQGDVLRVLQQPSERSDGLVLGKVRSRVRLEPPFCPPEAVVLVRRHQVAQRLSLWEELGVFLGKS